MFKASIKAETMNEALNALTAFLDEAKFDLNADGIDTRAVDLSNVAMVDLKLSKAAFESFSCDNAIIAIDLTKLSNALGMTREGDLVELELDEVAHKLRVSYSGLTYTLSLLDPSTIRKEPKIPVLSLPCKVVVDGAQIRRAVKAAEKISDCLTLGTKGETFYLEAIGDLDQVKLELTKDKLIELTTNQEVKSTFSLDYLSDISKEVANASEATIQLGKDYPIKINFKIANGNGDIEYIIAPRIEAE
jgi:proliferating cell nuclear antigen